MTTTAKHMTGKSARKIATTKATEAAAAKAPVKAPKAVKAPAKAPKAKQPTQSPKATTAKVKAAPKARGKQGIVTINDPKFVFGGEGSVRRASWDALSKLPAAQRTLAAYKAAGGLTKYIKRWESAGVITVKGAA